MDTPQTPSADAKLDDTPLQTQVVNNIPIHIAASPAPVPAQPTDENKIMRAVGDQLAKEDQSKPKHHLFSKAQPTSQPKPTAHTQPPAPYSNAPQTAAQPSAAKPAPKHPTKTKSRAPIAVILVTVLVTAGLIVLTVSALK